MTVDQNGLSCSYPFFKHLNEDEIRVLRTMGSEWYNVHGLVGVGFSEDKAKKIINRLAQVGAVGLRRGVQAKSAFPKRLRILKSISDVS